MLVVSRTVAAETADREEIDRAARDIVLHEYRNTLPWDETAEQARFDAALEAYLRSFPYVSKAIAQQAVVVILASAGT